MCQLRIVEERSRAFARWDFTVPKERDCPLYAQVRRLECLRPQLGDKPRIDTPTGREILAIA